jgi:hypothetical protein
VKPKIKRVKKGPTPISLIAIPVQNALKETKHIHIADLRKTIGQTKKKESQPSGSNYLEKVFNNLSLGVSFNNNEYEVIPDLNTKNSINGESGNSNNNKPNFH